MIKIFEDNENDRTVFTIIVDHDAKTVGIKWVDAEGKPRGVVLEE